MAEFQKALQIEPNNPLFLNRVAWTLATSRQARCATGTRGCNWLNGPMIWQAGKIGILATLAAALPKRQFSDAMLTPKRP